MSALSSYGPFYCHYSQKATCHMPEGPKLPATGVRRVIRRAPTPASDYDEPTVPSQRAQSLPTHGAPAGGRWRAAAPERPVVRRPAGAPSAPPAAARRAVQGRRDDGVDDADVYAGAVSTGWGGAKQLKADMPSDFPQAFTVPETPVIIKFLQHEPFANFRQHWASWLPPGSKLSYVCPNTRDRQVCPICGKGDRPAAKFAFNLVDFTDPENPINSFLLVGFKLSKVLEGLDTARHSGPLDREDLYYSIHKTGSSGGRGRRGSGTVQTNLNPVKDRDLVQDWDVSPLEPTEMDYFLSRAYTWEDVAPPTSLSVLEDVASQMGDLDQPS